MGLWELVNPSDLYTFYAEREVAALVVMLFGPMYGADLANSRDDLEPIPLFASGEWFEEQFGRSAKSAFDGQLDAVISALDSFVIGNRKLYEMGSEGRTGDDLKCFREEWHDQNRSSLNDIGKRANALAEGLRKRRDHEGEGKP